MAQSCLRRLRQRRQLTPIYMSEQKTEIVLHTEADLKKLLAGTYLKQINNFFGDESKALRFLSGVVAATQRNPKLLDCTPASVINSFMTMAQLQLMPSDVSGEAYVIPYNNKKQIGSRWESVLEAQFQLGYQGLVTLFYRAGVKEIVAEIVYEKDEFAFVNGKVNHHPDVFSQDRGKAKGAYVIVRLGTGGEVCKVMSREDILEIAETFSKSYKSTKSPWQEESDPQLWMWKKTVLKQTAKLVPKSDILFQAISEDNRDSNIEERKLENLPPAVDMEDCRAKLLACADLETLGRVWSALPIEAKTELVGVKDEIKSKLTPPTPTLAKENEQKPQTNAIDPIPEGSVGLEAPPVVNESPAAKGMRVGMESVKTTV